MNDIEKYTIPTGDPFVDIGGYAIEEFSKWTKSSDIMDLISQVTDIYVDKWEAKINSFFLNSKITNPSIKMERKKEETIKYFQSLLENSIEHKIGFCRITGMKTELYSARRENSIITGSGSFVNFHHCFESGIMISKEALIRFYFVPFACELLQTGVDPNSKYTIIHSNNPNLTKFFARKTVSCNMQNLSSNTSTGVLKSDCKSPGTTLFRFIDNVMSKKKDTLKDIENSLTLYHFTNFGSSPEIKIYNIDAPVFRFYQTMHLIAYKEDWNKFVSQYYNNRKYNGAKWNKETEKIEWGTKKEIQEFDKKEYQCWSNRIYTKLMNDQSILREMKEWYSKERFNFKIVEIYQIGIRNMKRETIDKINQIADCILQINDEREIKKVITNLNKAKSGFELRRFIVQNVVIKNYKKNSEDDPILTVKEYSEYLFSDSEFWSEIRDVLLIAIYQRLHEKNIKIEIDEENLEIESDEE
jgi:hypothetical protein